MLGLSGNDAYRIPDHAASKPEKYRGTSYFWTPDFRRNPHLRMLNRKLLGNIAIDQLALIQLELGTESTKIAWRFRKSATCCLWFLPSTRCGEISEMDEICWVVWCWMVQSFHVEIHVRFVTIVAWQGVINLPEFRAVMLASLRSVVPQDWAPRRAMGRPWEIADTPHGKIGEICRTSVGNMPSKPRQLRQL